MSTLTEETTADPGTGAGPQTVLANARLALADGIRPGSLRISGGRIADISGGTGVPPGAIDCEGALVMPGLVELHTDNLEKHLRPRPGVHWPKDAAVLAHDGEIASAGITTVFDAIRVGTLTTETKSFEGHRYSRAVATEIGRMRAAGALRIDHLIHLRAEICSHTLLEELDEFAGEDVGIVSIMDHTPGQRQFADEAKYRQYYQGKHGMSDAEMDAFVAATKALFAEVGERHEAGAVERAQRLGAVIASHDDTTPAHVERSISLGVGFAEFPTSLDAARAYGAAGVPVMMGAPNMLRGGSHSGNVAAAALAEEGLLDILSSDYAPSALLMGAMRLGELTGDLPGALATVTSRPAAAAGLADRGRIEIGLRADLVRVGTVGSLPVVAGVWSAGRQIG